MVKSLRTAYLICQNLIFFTKCKYASNGLFPIISIIIINYLVINYLRYNKNYIHTLIQQTQS